MDRLFSRRPKAKRNDPAPPGSTFSGRQGSDSILKTSDARGNFTPKAKAAQKLLERNRPGF